MSRIFQVQAKNIDTFRRKKRRKLKKGDVIRIGKDASTYPIRRFMDLRPQTKDVLATQKYANRLITTGGVFRNLEIGHHPGGFGHSGILPAGSIFSKEAQEVLNRFPNDVPLLEALCIAQFVDNEVLNENWQKYDSFYHFGLSDEQNARTSWVGPEKEGTLEGGASHEPGIGFNFDGIDSYFDTDFIASVDGINYQQDNARIGAFSVDIAGEEYLVSAEIGAGHSTIRNRVVSNLVQTKSNAASADSKTGKLPNDTLAVTSRKASGNYQYYENGIQKLSPNRVSDGLPTTQFRIGARNTGAATLFYTGVISSFQVTSAINFNETLHYDNLTTLNNCLLSSGILGRFPQPLEDFEETAILKFILEEAIAGNLGLYDEFYCFPLTNEANALHGWFTKTAINNGATHKPGIGFEFNGTNAFLNSNFNPFVDGKKYIQNDAQYGAFVKEFIAGTAVVGNADGGVKRNHIQDANFAINNAGSTSTHSGLTNDGLFIAKRDEVNNTDLLKNTVSIRNSGFASDTPINFNLYIAAKNTSNSAGSFMEGLLSTFQIGASIGFNQTAHYENLINLLQDLDVFANQVLSRYTGLTQTEIDAIRTFVRAEVDNRNWFKVDEFWAFGLSGANALIGMKSKTAVNFGTILSVEGARTNGTTQYINTNFIPSIDANNYVQDNAKLEAFLLKTTNVHDIQTLIGSSNGGANSNLQVSNDTTQWIRGQVNQASGEAIATLEGPEDGRLYEIARLNSSTVRIYKDGVQIDTESETSNGLPTGAFFVGAKNLGGGPSGFFGGTISTTMIAAQLGINRTTHYNNLLQFLIDLGTFSQPVIDSFPNPLTSEEEIFIKDFVDSQVVSGNWFKMDSFAHLGLLDPANALWDWKRRSAMTNSSAIHRAGVGYKFTGTQRIVSNYIPSTDAINYKLNDAFTGGFIVENTNTGVKTGLVYGGSGDTPLSLFQNGASQLSGRINSAGAISYTADAFFKNNTLYLIRRTTSTSENLVKNGVQVVTNTVTSTALSTEVLTIGATSVGSQDFHGTISSFIAGAAIGFNHSNYYAELVILNNALRLDAIINSFPNPLTSEEEAALRLYLNDEMVNGNFQKLDSLAFLNLLDPVNALWDVIQGVGMTNVLMTHVPGTGWKNEVGATAYIDTNFVPSTILGTDFEKFGAIYNIGSVGTEFFGVRQGSTKNFLMRISGATEILIGQTGNIGDQSSFNTPNSYLGIYRLSTVTTLYKDGVSTGITHNQNADTYPSIPIFLGARNLDGVPVAGGLGVHVGGTFSVGSSIGYNHSAGYTNLLAFMVSLTPFSVDEQAYIDANPSMTDRQKLVFHQYNQQWITRLTAPTALEETAITDFVGAESLADNIEKYDEFWCLSLAGANSLVGMRVKTASLVNAPIHDINGYTFNGSTQYILTNWTPSIDGVNYKLNNALIEFFAKTITGANVNRLSGVSGATGWSRVGIGTGASISYSCNADGSNTFGSGIGDGSLVAAGRKASTNHLSYLNGVQQASTSTASTILPTLAMAVGADRNGASSYRNYYSGTISTFFVGALNALDYPAHNTNLRKLLTDLGVIL